MPRSVGNSASPPTSDRATRAKFRPRRMTIGDVGDVGALEARIFPDPWSADSFLAEVERKPDIGYPITVRRDRELVAYAVVWFIVDEIHIGNIAVHPDHQGEGLGSALLEHILEEGRRRSLAFATLEVRPSNGTALALYERYGFERIAVRRRYYLNDHEDAWVLAYPLSGRAARRRA